MMLRGLGNEVRTDDDGQQAVVWAGAFRPDLMLLDIGMPKLNVYETARRIREQPWGQDMTLVALSGWGQEEDKQQAAAAGFDAHLVKPVDPAALERLLGTVTPRPV
jgi:CheY-like chemotaxis protein